MKCIITFNIKIAMSNIKSALYTALLMVPTLFFAQHTDIINSNRPGESMSAYAIGKKVIQAEVGTYAIKQHHALLDCDKTGVGLDATLRWGVLTERLEVIADIQYQYEKYNARFIEKTNSALRQTVLGAKYLLFDPYKNSADRINLYSWKANHSFNWEQFIPAVSVFAGANIIGKDNPYYYTANAEISPKLMLITQNHFGDGSWVFVTNIIADYVATDDPSYGYIITLTKAFNREWSGFVENQGFKSDFYSDAIVRAGAAYLLSDDIQIDASISSSLKDTPSILYGGVGISWRYDAKHKDVKLFKPTDLK